MAYVRYDSLPLYFHAANSTIRPGPNSDGGNFSIAAQNVQINYSPSVQTQRFVGKLPSDTNTAIVGPPNISMSCTFIADTVEFDPCQRAQPLHWVIRVIMGLLLAVRIYLIYLLVLLLINLL
jgi:hypothetical protein